MDVPGGTALLFDDYGHHPVELKATLTAAKSVWPDRRVVLVFQPHRYTRTRDLLLDFIDVLTTVDQLVLTEVYAASEQTIPGADGQSLFEAVKKTGAQHAEFVPELAELPSRLQQILKPNDIVILQGAGNIVTMVDVLKNRARS
jgi:UDP-N-acetylmuramate--alanine ligase